MKRIALVEKGVVHDIVMVGHEYEAPKGSLAIESETANIGDKHDGNVFIKPNPPSIKMTPQGLIEYVRLYRASIVNSGIDFNLASPGEDLKIVRIPGNSSIREEIRDLAWLAEVTGEDTILVTNNDVLTLSAKQIVTLRERLAEHIHRSHIVAAKLIDGIIHKHVTSKNEIEAPEKAANVKIPGWRKHG